LTSIDAKRTLVASKFVDWRTFVSELQEQIRQRYAAAATAAAAGCCESDGWGACCSIASCAPDRAEVDAAFGAGLYDADERSAVPPEAVAASLGCGNPLAVADLRPGERVLDLGSGGGIDVLLSARRVGPTGFVYGVDMTGEMLALARQNAAKAGVTNVEFVQGTIEAVPLPAASVDVVISNCVINLAVDKRAVFAEAFRVLAPGGRLGVADVVAEDGVAPEERAERGSWVGCVAGALSRQEYLDGLAAAGFGDAVVVFTGEAAPGMHTAIVRATKPAAGARNAHGTLAR
jgi:SAM-dependent methyltransferase